VHYHNDAPEQQGGRTSKQPKSRGEPFRRKILKVVWWKPEVVGLDPPCPKENDFVW
jgi:hypothetical protein